MLSPIAKLAFLMIAQAQGATGRTGALLMREPFGARAFSLGQAYIALGDDAFAMSYNPASLTRLRQSNFGTQYGQSIADTQLGQAVFATPLSPTHAVGVGVGYLDEGKLDLIDDAGNQTGRVNLQRDLLLHLGYGYRWNALGLGAAAKLLKSTLTEDAQATAYAADAGALYSHALGPGRAAGGLAITNVGKPLRYSGGIAAGTESDPLPLALRLGASYAQQAFPSDTLAVTGELERVFYDQNQFASAGLEYLYHGLCAFRIGYRGGPGGGLRVGTGLALRNLSIDYGIGLVQALNNVQQVSLNYRFTIPGIRYSEAAPPSPLETLVKNARQDIDSRRYFSALSEVEKMETFFPDSAAASQWRVQLIDAVNNDLTRSPQSFVYLQAAAFKAFSEKRWEDAVRSLDAALKLDPENSETRKSLAKARRQLAEQQERQKVDRQATIGTLYELADKAFEAGDDARALRILDNIDRLAPYAPADNLRRRITDRKKAAVKLPPPASAPKPQTAAPRPEPSAEDVRKADALYWEAIRFYTDGDFDRALASLREGLKLNPNAENLKVTEKYILREAEQRQKAR